MPKDIIVNFDTREQKPWLFEKEEAKSGYAAKVIACEQTTIDAADYTIQGYENIIRIERKANFAELYNNMLPKSNQERFEREMEKLRDVKHKYIIVESNLNEDLWGMSPQQVSRGPGCGKIVQWLIELQQEYGIVPLFVGNCGKKVVRKIFDNIVKEHG